MGEPPGVSRQRRWPAGDFPSGGAGGNWMCWEPAGAVGGSPAIQPGCIQGGLTKLKPDQCLMKATNKQKWKREHAETERKEVSEDQLVTSVLTFVITHRKCEGKVQEMGYLPWAVASPHKIGVAFVSRSLGPGCSYSLL